MTLHNDLQARIDASPELRRELETALAQGGVPAAAEVAARHGLGTHEELSDLELELISAGKVSVGAGARGGRGGGWGGFSAGARGRGGFGGAGAGFRAGGRGGFGW